MTTQTEPRIHVFERANLAQAPYRFLGVREEKYQAHQGAPIQPGSSCDYCGTAIMSVFRFRGRDGREFKVGSECALRSGDAGMKRIVTAAERVKARATRAKAAGKVQDALATILTDEAKRARLAAVTVEIRPGWTKTLLESAEWMTQNAGHAGRTRILRQIKTAIPNILEG